MGIQRSISIPLSLKVAVPTAVENYELINSDSNTCGCRFSDFSRLGYLAIKSAEILTILSPNGNRKIDVASVCDTSRCR